MSPAATAVSPLARVLVVDDELGPRESLRMLLKPHYQIQTAENGRVALDQLPRFQPDVVIMDIKMPEMDGLELLRHVKRADPSIEVVMITAYASLETVKHALTHGAFEYLIKPFSRQDLEDVIHRALQRRQAEIGARGQVAKLVEEMRQLSANSSKLEEAARREAAEQSLRVTQMSIVREMRTIVEQLDPQHLTAFVTEQLRVALGYDKVEIVAEPPRGIDKGAPAVMTCAIQHGGGALGHLVVDNRTSRRPIDPRERELLEMLSEYLAIALRNSRLYGQLTERNRFIEQLIASAGDAIIAVSRDDRVEGSIWNPTAERIFGLTAEQANGRSITELLPRGDYGEAKRRLAEGADRHAFETSLTIGQARPVELAVTLSARHGRQGGLEGLIAIVRDITAQREIETQHRRSEKLTALGQLAGGIAHDFNNLLQAILGYAQLMKQNPRDAEFVSRSLNIVEAAAVDGSETVRRIQQFARLRPDEPPVGVDLNQMVHDAVALIRPRWEEKIARDNRPLDLRLNLGTIETINGRPPALTEVLTNLILNALDAMPDGGTLTIDTRSDGRHIALTVNDTGIGMSEAVRRRIFEPFFSTKGEGGSGLGLSMVYSIVRRHGGDIRVESEPGRGATFTLTFPIASEPVGAVPDTGLRRARRPARVLLVDDDQKVLGTLTEQLRSVGHTVTAAASGGAGLATFAPGRFDVVLSNLGMAGINGWELAERIRRVDSQASILLITGWGLREEDHGRLKALRIRKCLFKPVRINELDTAIQDSLAAV